MSRKLNNRTDPRVMSLRLERCSNGECYEEPTIRWADAELDMAEDEIQSISSEEENGSEYDGEQSTREKSVSEIWDNSFIWSRLQSLTGAEEITDLLKQDKFDLTTTHPQSTALLIATWLNKEDAVKKLLQTDKSRLLQTTDQDGRTLLHLAACAGNLETLKLLLQNNCNVNAKDPVHNATPLHCAASKRHLACLKMLIRYGADVNANLTHKSPLLYAVQSQATDCAKELLEHNAIPNTPQVFSETPLHVAASLGASDIVKLLLAHGAAVNVQSGPDKLTPLHLAAEDGDSECVRLLIQNGANLESLNNKKQTPLHLAALSQCTETLELLLEKGASSNARDKDGRTPLHSAIVKVSRSCECVRLLLNARADVNQQDSFGYTPLHLAALNEFSSCVMLLLNHGGDVTVRTKGGISVLAFITRKTPDVIPKYIQKFDNSIKLNEHEIGDVDCEVKLDFRVLVPSVGNKETELLLNFIEVGHREILKHPLCETFLFLKWRRIRKYFLFSLFYHSLFVLLYTVYVIGVFLKNCPSMRRLMPKQSACHISDYIKAVGYLLLMFNFLLMCKELFQIFHSWSVYVKQWENWLQWLIIISAFCCVQPVGLIDVRRSMYVWQHHVAAVGIFLSWIELMMIVGRFPIFGLYIQMFTTVSINFVKFVAAYFCLLIAFALSFGILFANYKSFKDLKWVIIKVLVMLSGELEYEDMFYDESSPILYEWTAQVMFLVFVILVTVILTNLMVGLAVSDIQGLQQSAGLDRLVRQAELVAHLESMLFSRLLKCVPHKLMNFFHKQALLLKSQYHWALYIKPNDPREERIPRDLIKAIYQLVSERKEKPRIRRNNYYNYYESLSRINSKSSGCCEEDIKKTNFNLKTCLDDINNDFVEFSANCRQKLNMIGAQIQNIKLDRGN